MKELMSDIDRIESVNKRLQLNETTMLEARILFDGIIETFGAKYNIYDYLAEMAPIVQYPIFEAGLIKLARNEKLNTQEALEMAIFEKDVSEETVNKKMKILPLLF